LRKLLAALTPFVVRAGGTWACTWEDGIFWEGGPKSGRPPHVKPGMSPHALTEAAWRPFAELMTQLGDLVEEPKVNASLVFKQTRFTNFSSEV
jgi:hypothetical protein